MNARTTLGTPSEYRYSLNRLRNRSESPPRYRPASPMRTGWSPPRARMSGLTRSEAPLWAAASTGASISRAGVMEAAGWEQPPTRSSWSRKMAFLPELGQPGGRDDPLRRGLSGAQCKWYLRGLSQGISPDTARRIAVERKNLVQEHERNIAVSQQSRRRMRGNIPREASKRARVYTGGTSSDSDAGPSVKTERIGLVPENYLLEPGLTSAAEALVQRAGTTTAQRRTLERERRVRIALQRQLSESMGDNTPKKAKASLNSKVALDTVKTQRIAVVPKNFPKETLTREELTSLEEALVQEIAKGWNSKLRFAGIHFKASMLTIDCHCDKTAEWVRETIPNLQWGGKELTTKEGEAIFMPQIISVFFPKSTVQDEQKIIDLVAAQNDGINTEEWKVLTIRSEGPGVLMTLGIDNNSAEAIQKAGHILHYRFGTISVRRLKKNQENHEQVN